MQDGCYCKVFLFCIDFCDNNCWLQCTGNNNAISYQLNSFGYHFLSIKLIWIYNYQLVIVNAETCSQAYFADTQLSKYVSRKFLEDITKQFAALQAAMQSLQTTVQHQQTKIEDQQTKIEALKKEVNSSRIDGKNILHIKS